MTLIVGLSRLVHGEFGQVQSIATLDLPTSSREYSFGKKRERRSHQYGVFTATAMANSLPV